MKKIMISYGRKDASEFANELKNILEDNAYEVWLDRAEIKGGYAWENQIEIAIEESDIVIAILSPHAIRRSEGVCLDEISMARFKGKLIIPIMYKYIEPPLCIFRLDWIDFLKYESIKSKEDDGKEKLFKSIKEGKIAYEGKNTQFKVLKSINFDARLTALRKDFIGREWIFDANKSDKDSLINQWLGSNKNILLILGDPGIGKSAISAHLIEKHPACVAYHFCIAKDEETLNPSKFIKSIAHQLTSQLGNDYVDLILAELDDGLPKSSATLFRTLIANPISQLNLNKIKFILVDGLDEASRFNASNKLLELISTHFIEALPRNIRFIFTSRNDKQIISRFEVYDPFKIITSDDRNIEDMKNYILHMLEKYKMEKLSSDEIDKIIDVSEGNILYIKQIFKNPEKRIDVDKLPKGLWGIYDEYFNNTFLKHEYMEYKELFSILIAVYIPITVNLLEIILNEEGIKNSKLKKIAAYFPVNSENIITVFHKSFFDWLRESSTYSVEEIVGHRKIIDAKLDLENQDELQIYLYSATKIFIHKQNRRDIDIDDFFNTTIKTRLSKLDDSSSSEKLKKELEALISLDNEYNKKYRDVLKKTSEENDNSNTVDKLGDLFKKEPEKWAEDYTTSLNNLANSYVNQNRIDKAKELQEIALKILQKLYKENPARWAEDYTTSLNNLANSYTNLNRLNEATELQTSILELLRELYKENSNRWAKAYITSLNNLANSYTNLNRADKAKELQESALEILQKLYEENPTRWVELYTTLLNNLAISYNNQNRIDEVIELQKSILEILQKLYEENPARWAEPYITSLNNLAFSFFHANNIANSLNLFDINYKIHKKHYGDGDERTLKALSIIEKIKESYKQTRG